MRDIRVVHVAASPLVSSPLKIAAVCQPVGISALCFCENDYPAKGPLHRLFTDGMLVLSDAMADMQGRLIDALQACDVVHVHNYVSQRTVELIDHHAPNAALVHHVHSPLKEGPLYIDRSATLGLSFDRLLVVAQYQPRMYPHHTPVPNVVPAAPSLRLRQDGDKLRLCFTPTHAQEGRWNAKTSPQFEQAMQWIGGLRQVELLVPQGAVLPASLLNLRRFAHASIDEVITGGFHQVSLESMVCGNATINGADHFSLAALCDCLGAPRAQVPFVQASVDDIRDVVGELARHPELTRHHQRAAFDFARRYLEPSHIAGLYRKVYESVL